VEDGKTTLYGEGWVLENGTIREICRVGETLAIS
jgi:hypothetical protein